MTESDLHILLNDLCSQPREQQWLEFKLNKGSITNEQIGEYISAMSNGATISNKAFGYLVWGVEDETLTIKGTNFTFENAKQGNQDLELWVRSLLHPKINSKFSNLTTAVNILFCYEFHRPKANQHIFKRNRLYALAVIKQS